MKLLSEKKILTLEAPRPYRPNRMVYIGRIKNKNTNDDESIDHDGKNDFFCVKRNNENYEKDKIRCYCFNCKKEVVANINHVYFNKKIMSFFMQENNLNTQDNIVCSECGQVEINENILHLGIDYVTSRNYFLDGNKLKIKTLSKKFKYFNNHFLIDNNMDLITLNLDTGFAYKFPRYINGKKRKKSKSIINATFSNVDFINCRDYSFNTKNYNDFLFEIFNVIRDYKIKHLNLYIPTYKEQVKTYNENNTRGFITDFLNYSSIFLFNRYPTLNFKLASRLFLNSTHKYFNENNNKEEKLFQKMRRGIKCTEKDPIGFMLKSYNIPQSKINKKRIYNYSFLLAYYKIKNILKIDNINKLFNNCSNYSNISRIIHCAIPLLKSEKNFNENNFINKITNNGDLNYLNDSCNMFSSIKSRNPDYKINFKGTIRNIHDRISKDYHEMKYKKIEINHEKKYKNLEGTYGELNFIFPKDNIELINIGKEMHICVGSYGEKAISKKTNIIVAKDKNDTKICIELTPNYHRIIQAKLTCNNKIEENTIEYEAITKWIEANNLYVNTYSDIPEKYKEKNNKEIPYFLDKEKGKKVNVGLYGNVIG